MRGPVVVLALALLVSASGCASRPGSASSGAAARTDRTPYTVAQLASVPQISDVALARDGSELAFLSDASGAVELWTARVQSGIAGVPVQRTTLAEQVHGIEYSLHGDLVFLADKGGDERPDLFLLKRGAVAAERIAATETAEEDPTFSPDGRRLAYTADADRAFRFNVMVMDLETKKTRQLTREPVNVYAPIWSPDAKTLVATVTPDDQKGELLVIDVATGKTTRRIAPLRTDGILWAVEFLPSGKLLGLTTNDKGFTQLCTVDLGKGRVELAGPGDWDVEQAAASPKTGRIVFARNVRGESEIWSMLAKDLARWDDPAYRKRLSTTGVVAEIAVDANGAQAAFVRESSVRPAEVWLANPAAEQTALAVPVVPKGVDLDALVPAVLREFESFDGRKIDAYLWLPADKRLGSPPPAVVRVHGGPDDQLRAAFDPEMISLVEAGFVVIGPNYRGSTGYGREFADLNNKDWGGGDLKDLVAIVNALAAKGEIDAKRVGIMGGSYGGYMTLRALTATPEVWAAGVERFGMPDLVEDYRLTVDRFGSWYETEMGTPETHAALFKERSPIHRLDQVRAPLFVFQGENDTNVPRAESDLVVEALKKRGAPVEYRVYPNEGHGFTRRENRIDNMQATLDFFTLHLGTRK